MKQLFANNAKTTLTAPLGATDTALVVADGSKFPTPNQFEYFLVTVELGTSLEILMVTGRTGNTLTIGGLIDVGQTIAGRGQEGTGAQAFLAGAKVEGRVTQNTLVRMSKGLAAISSVGSMVAPKDSYNDGYVIGTLDPFNNPIVAVTKDTLTWRFLNFTSQYANTSTAATTTSITGTSIPISDVATGKYIVQFTSGNQAGKIRSVTSIAANAVTFSPALTTAAVAGDTFEILKANASIVADALANLTFPIANNTGTSDALTATYSSAAASLVDNTTVLVVTTTVNATGAPTFSPNSLVPKTIRNNDGSALAAGQLTGTLMLRYESTSDDWRLVGTQQSSVAQPINYFLGNL